MCRAAEPEKGLTAVIRRLFLPGLLDTAQLGAEIVVVRDGPVNFYVLRAPDGLVCMDAGWRPSRVAREFAAQNLDLRDVAAVFVTHLHWDHARGIGSFPRAQVFVGERERRQLPATWPKPARPLAAVRDGQTVSAAGLAVRVIATPGHTDGSVSYLTEGGFLFSGDTIRLRRGEARPFVSPFNTDPDGLERSVAALAALNDVKCLLTAHSGVSMDPPAAFQRWRKEHGDARGRSPA